MIDSKYRILIVIYIIISFFSFIPFTFSTDQLEIPKSNTIKVMTYNLHFGVGETGYDLKAIIDTIEKTNPDVVGFQEITLSSPFNGFATMYNDMLEMMEDLGFSYNYVSDGFNYNLVNVIFSKFLISSPSTTDYSSQSGAYQRNFIQVNIDVNGFALTVLDTHLTHKPGGGKSGRVRVNQARQLINFIGEYDLANENVVLTGDFNIIDTTPEYNIIAQLMFDAWKSTNLDQDGFTSSVENPNKRIDMIFISQAVLSNSCEVSNSQASDHFPLICEVQLS